MVKIIETTVQARIVAPFSLHHTEPQFDAHENIVTFECTGISTERTVQGITAVHRVINVGIMEN